MFLIRLAFWLGLVVLLLPADERQQARVYGAATATVERISTFCERNARLCAGGAEVWATFLKKAEFGARMVAGLVNGPEPGIHEPVQPVPQPTRVRPEPRLAPAARGTLTPDDLAPAWRGQPNRQAGRSGA